MSFRWTFEWFHKWTEQYVSMLIEGRQNYPDALGFLRIAEALLKILKANMIENSISDEVLKDLRKLVVYRTRLKLVFT
jgi:hypothetical protein